MTAMGIHDFSFGTLKDVGSMGYYWSSAENHDTASTVAVCLKFSSLNNSDIIALANRYALSVRPVAK